jgi:hypothetical protein
MSPADHPGWWTVDRSGRDMVWSHRGTGATLHAMRDQATGEWILVAEPTGTRSGGQERLGVFDTETGATRRAARWAREHSRYAEGQSHPVGDPDFGFSGGGFFR